MTPADSSSPSREEIRSWLSEKLQQELGRDAPVETSRPLADYGLESRIAIGVAGDLEDWLGMELDPTMFFDHPSIDQLARFLHDELHDAR